MFVNKICWHDSNYDCPACGLCFCLHKIITLKEQKFWECPSGSKVRINSKREILEKK